MTAAAPVSSGHLSLASSDHPTPSFAFEEPPEFRNFTDEILEFRNLTEEDFEALLIDVALSPSDDPLFTADDKSIDLSLDPDEDQINQSPPSTIGSVHYPDDAVSLNTTKASDMSSKPSKQLSIFHLINPPDDETEKRPSDTRSAERSDDSDNTSEYRYARSNTDDRTADTWIETERGSTIDDFSRPDPVATTNSQKELSGGGEEREDDSCHDDESRREPEELEQARSPSVDRAEPSNDDDASEGVELAIEEFQRHRVDKKLSLVDIEVRWEDGATSWEQEGSLQEQVPELIFDYWAERGGRQAATGLDQYHVFKILKKRRNPLEYLIQWVGYRHTGSDATWESKRLLQRICPKLLEEYETKFAAKAVSLPRKRGIAQARDRPNKRSKGK